MTLHYDNMKPWLLSLLIHAAILVMLSAFIIVPILGPQWYEIRFEEPPIPPLNLPTLPSAAGQTSSPAPSQPALAASPSPKTSTPLPREPLPTPPQPSQPEEEDYSIATPTMSAPPNKQVEYRLPSGPKPGSLIPGFSGSGSGGISSSVRSNVEGSSVFFIIKVKTHPFAYNGSVRLQFRLSSGGRLLQDSVVPLQYPNKEMADFAQQLLAQGTFTSRGAFRTEALYEITIEFK